MRIKTLAAVVLWLSASGALCQSWTIGNDRIERNVTFDASSGLVTQRLTDLTTHTEFIAPEQPTRRPALEFSLVCDGETLTGASFQLVKADQTTLPDKLLRQSLLSLYLFNCTDCPGALRIWQSGGVTAGVWAGTADRLRTAFFIHIRRATVAHNLYPLRAGNYCQFSALGGGALLVR